MGLLAAAALVACGEDAPGPADLGATDASTADMSADMGLAGPVILRDIDDLRDQVVEENDLPVRLRDGTRLEARVFRPAAAGTHPVIMAFTAYGKHITPDEYPAAVTYGELDGFDPGTFEVSPWTAWEAPDPATWVPLGYAVVFVDVRGYHGSEGEASLLSNQDADDFYDVIEWAGAQEWSDGNVGLMGVSYLAISQWVAAGGSPPSLKAVVPWEGQTDSFREVTFHGGVPETAFTQFWLSRLRSQANIPALPTVALLQFLQQEGVQSYLATAPVEAIALERVTVPALVCATWSDHGLHSRGSFEAFKRIASTEKWLFTHGRQKWAVFYSDEAFELQRRFLDRFLKGVDNGMDDVRRVRLEVRESLNEHVVRFEDEWPLARTEYRQLFLDAESGTLVEEAPTTEGAARYLPLTDAATFTHTFEADTELTGNMKLRLWVSTTEGTDMDLFVGIEKLDASGEVVHFYGKAGFAEHPVALGWLRVSERALDEARSTPAQPWLAHDDPRPLTPGEVVPVDIEILPSSTLFRAGETLRVRVQGADLFEHPTLGHGFSADVNVGEHAIHTGGRYDAHLLVPVVP
ncbi:MAG: CocE/NonD family hydrolase [Myxococcota bacterium]